MNRLNKVLPCQKSKLNHNKRVYKKYLLKRNCKEQWTKYGKKKYIDQLKIQKLAKNTKGNTAEPRLSGRWSSEWSVIHVRYYDLLFRVYLVIKKFEVASFIYVQGSTIYVVFEVLYVTLHYDYVMNSNFFDVLYFIKFYDR